MTQQQQWQHGEVFTHCAHILSSPPADTRTPARLLGEEADPDSQTHLLPTWMTHSGSRLGMNPSAAAAAAGGQAACAAVHTAQRPAATALAAPPNQPAACQQWHLLTHCMQLALSCCW